MAVVDVEVNGRMYRLTCEAGQEVRIRELADAVDQRVRAGAGGGRVGSDAQMLLLAAIQIADELRDVVGGRNELAARGLIGAGRDPAAEGRLAEAARTIDELALRIETVASRLERA